MVAICADIVYFKEKLIMTIKNSILYIGIWCALPLAAQENGAAGDGANSEPARAMHRERLIKHFDKDGDGKLNEEEKAEMRRFIEKNKGEHRRGRRKGESRMNAEGAQKHEELMKKYDKDEDGKLSEEEMKEMREDLAKQRAAARKGKKDSPAPEK